MWKRFRTVAMVAFMCLISFVLISCGKYGKEAIENKKLILEYVEENYGKDYKVVNEYLGNRGASGRHGDHLDILQNGIKYRVSAKDVLIYRDTYMGQYAGKLISEHFEKEFAKGLEEIEHELECGVNYVGDKPVNYISGNLLQTPESVKDIVEMEDVEVNMILNVYAETLEERESYRWAYDIMKEYFETFSDADFIFSVSNRETDERYYYHAEWSLARNPSKDADDFVNRLKRK